MSNTTESEIVVIDGLMYQNQPFIKRYQWDEAKKYAKNLRLGGYDDWRLPTIAELGKVRNPELDKMEALETYRDWMLRHKKLLYKNSIGKTCFTRKEFAKNMPEYSFFWSSTEYASNESVRVEYFNNIRATHIEKENQDYVLCVRNM